MSAITDEKLAEIIEYLDQYAVHEVDESVRIPALDALLELQQLRITMSGLTPDQRLDRRDKLMAGYCNHCGGEDLHGTCQCWNDD